MNESSVSSPFMSQLRERLPGSVVIKHSDTSMIGLPDCSVHYRGNSFWFEFKLWTPLKSWSIDEPMPVRKLAEASPAQFEMMKRLNQHRHGAAYIIWCRKTRAIEIWWVGLGSVHRVKTTPELVEYIAGLIESKW